MQILNVKSEANAALRTLRVFLEAIKFEHTIFALPFALMGMLYAANGLPSARITGWILVAMVSARTAAMAFNRIADYDVDILNPRTCNRALPAGQIGMAQMKLFMMVAIALFVLAAWQLNPLCLWLSPVALFVILGYSYTKRFTALSHFWLGLSLGLAPSAAWIAVCGRLDPQPLWLTGAVTLWVAGFDILYSLQDDEFDRIHGLHSLPQAVGRIRAIFVSRVCHVLCVALLIAAGLSLQVGWLYYMGAGIAALLLAYEHSLIKPDDLSKLNVAFFTLNGFMSIGLFLFAFMDWLL